jgi:O-antigen ligase
LFKETKLLFKQAQPLKSLELLFLSLFILTLPSLEAPKNVFLAGFVLIALWNQFQMKKNQAWGAWDSVFFFYISAAFLSAIFAGFAPGDEWRGFRGMLLTTSFGWLITRINFKKIEVSWLFGLAIFAVIPPLVWGMIELKLLHSKTDLQLHSVGHVNHSAIYLAMTFGAMLSYILSAWKSYDLIKRTALILLNLFMFYGLMVGQSRGALGIALLLTGLLILFMPNTKKIKLFSIVFLSLIIIFMFIFKANVIEKHISDQKANNVLAFRDVIWNTSVEAARFYPLFGIGNGNWHRINLDEIKTSVESRGLSFNKENYVAGVAHSHSLFLTALVERGFVGFLALITLMLFWLIGMKEKFKQISKSTQNAYLWGGALSAWVITFGVGFVNSTFHHEHALLALLLLGLCINPTIYKRKGI